MATCLGKSCSFGLPRMPFVNCCQFMYLVVSILVLRAGCGIWLYQFQIIAYPFTLSFTFFRIWTSATPRPIPNVIWQFHGLHLVNTNVYAKFHYNISLSSRDIAFFTFSEVGARQNLDWRKMVFHNLRARSCQYQCLPRSLSKYSNQFKR